MRNSPLLKKHKAKHNKEKLNNSILSPSIIWQISFPNPKTRQPDPKNNLKKPSSMQLNYSNQLEMYSELLNASRS